MIRAISIFALACAPYSAIAQNVLPQAVSAYEEVCLASAPDFAEAPTRARNLGMTFQDGAYWTTDNAARVEIFESNGGCACMTAVIAPDPNATATALIKASVDAGPEQITEHPAKEITAVLVWKGGANALQVESDVRGKVPLTRVYLISQTACPMIGN